MKCRQERQARHLSGNVYVSAPVHLPVGIVKISRDTRAGLPVEGRKNPRARRER